MKYESLSSVKYLLNKHSHSVAFDLENGYYMVGICAEHQQYLGFEVAGVHFVYTALPFGLSASPYIFTKVVKVFAAFLRRPVFKSGDIFSV